MECPACHTRCSADDRFCGACGARLDEAAPEPQPAAAPCPLCGAERVPAATRCLVCNTEFDPPEQPAPVRRPAMECPTHGVMEGSWTLCPECLKDNRRVQLVEAGRPSPKPVRGDTLVIRRKDVRLGVLAFFVEVDGEHNGRVFPVAAEFTDIGRDQRNQVVLEDGRVSNFHARLRVIDGRRFALEDRGSSNGTRVNGEVLTQPIPVRDNDEIEVGATTLVFKVVRRRSRRARRKPDTGQ